MNNQEYAKDLANKARLASRDVASLTTQQKNNILAMIADTLIAQTDIIVSENQKDLNIAIENNLSEALVDRLRLTPDRIADMAQGVRDVIALPDPCGQILDGSTLENGLRLQKVSTPIGVVFMIYESRPNVTIDAGVLCFKAGNACILRCGKEAAASTQILGKVLSDALQKAGVNPDMIQVVNIADRDVVDALLVQDSLIDVVIPRGGHSLIKTVVAKSTIPVIKHYLGLCHTYIDGDADLQMAHNIAINAKVQRPGVCNAMETLLIDKSIAKTILPNLVADMRQKNVELCGCDKTCNIVDMDIATDEDWATEYLALKLSIKIVDGVQDAIEHINKYGSGHSEAIVTNNINVARLFQDRIDAATVYVNASTRFTDGAMFGLGAEIGISTDKLHARGPMGLAELTTYKFLVTGEGHIR